MLLSPLIWFTSFLLMDEEVRESMRKKWTAESIPSGDYYPGTYGAAVENLYCAMAQAKLTMLEATERGQHD
jgi:hypothetical protein